jgi:hypothetical protein
VRWRRSVRWREFTEDEQAGHDGTLEARGLAWAQLGRSGEPVHGLHTGTGAPASADHGGGGGRLTEASNHASYRARMIKIRARAGCSPRAEALVSRSNGGGARFDEATVADSGCARKRSSERGPYAIGRKRAH